MHLHAGPARVVLRAGTFCHDQARAISRRALREGERGLVEIDLTRARDATTAAFAALILLRRSLLRAGRDLRLVGLTGRARQLYLVNRLDGVLPADDEVIAAENNPWTPPGSLAA